MSNKNLEGHLLFYIILVHIALGSYLNVQYSVNHCQIQLPSSSFLWSLSSFFFLSFSFVGQDISSWHTFVFFPV
jgi:hypothetical protein